MDRQPLDFLVALAPHIRDALLRAFIAFTRTPIELKDANTRAVFGDYIDICDIKQAVDDHATVNIEPLTQPSPHKGARAGEGHRPAGSQAGARSSSSSFHRQVFKPVAAAALTAAPG